MFSHDKYLWTTKNNIILKNFLQHFPSIHYIFLATSVIVEVKLRPLNFVVNLQLNAIFSVTYMRSTCYNNAEENFELILIFILFYLFYTKLNVEINAWESVKN